MVFVAASLKVGFLLIFAGLMILGICRSYLLYYECPCVVSQSSPADLMQCSFLVDPFGMRVVHAPCILVSHSVQVQSYLANCNLCSSSCD